MLGYLQKAKEYLWAFVEIGFLAILAVMLIYLILGQDSGVFVTGVADNVLKFAQRTSRPKLGRDRHRAGADCLAHQSAAESLISAGRRGAAAKPARSLLTRCPAP